MNYQNWTGHGDPKLGYGSMLDGFKRAAPKGIKFDDKASVVVHMQTPQTCKGWLKGTHRVLFTMWETDTMYNGFIPYLNKFDQILVPCEDNVELFSKYNDDVTHVPLGVDTQFWSPSHRTDHKAERNVFRFHAGGSLWRRKGLDVLVRAFKDLDLPDAELHIKAAPHAFDTPKESPGKNIYLHREWMSKNRQRDWYAMADCFVAPARGEGFGLMPLQAIAMGIPTIISYSSGQKQFAHLATGVVSCGKSQAETCGQWDEPNQRELEDLMKAHYHHLPKVPTGVQEFDWAKSTRKLVSAVPAGKLLSTDEWEHPEVGTKVRALRPVNAIIGKTKVVMRKGETATVSSGVFQVLSDSGALEAV